MLLIKVHANLTVSVTDPPYNAAGDGITDDTAAIQQAIDDVHASGGGTVNFPDGTYLVVSVGLHEGITYQGTGNTVIQRPEYLTDAIGVADAKWVRTFTTFKPGYIFFDASGADSPPLVIRDLIFDGTSQTQGAYRNYELEQAALLFLHADPLSPSRLRTIVERCVFRNGVGDGVHFFTNVHADLVKCHAENCFRGGMTVTGGNSIITANGLTTVGDVDRTGIDVEIDSPGYNDSLATDIVLDRLILDADFDIGVQAGSTVEVNDTTVLAPPFNLHGQDSVLTLTDCEFRYHNLKGGGGRIIRPGDTMFSRCTFIAVDDGVPVAGLITAAPFIFWNTGFSAETDQIVRFLDCHFEAIPGLAGSHPLAAVGTGVTTLAANNQVEIIGGHITSDFNFGVKTDRGGRFHLEAVDIEAEIPFYGFGAKTFSGSPDYVDVTFENLQFTSPYAFFMYGFEALTGNWIRNDGVIVPVASNQILTQFGLESVGIEGYRTIQGFAPPTAATHGLVGDRYLAGVDVWGCVESGYDLTPAPEDGTVNVTGHKDAQWVPLLPLIPAPRYLQTTRRIGAEGISLAWTPVAGAEKYEILRSDARQPSMPTVIGFAEATNYTDADVQPGGIYDYQVRVIEPATGHLSSIARGSASRVRRAWGSFRK